MTEREKSRSQTEEEIAIILKSVSKSRTILESTFGKLWKLMHGGPYVSRKQSLVKTDDGAKERENIINSNSSRILNMLHSSCLSAAGVVLEKPEDYEDEIRLDDATTEEYVRKYSEQFNDMAEAFIIAAILSGNEEAEEVWNQMLIYRGNPRVAPVFKEVDSVVMAAVVAPLIESKGRGIYVSPFANFDRLTKQTIHTAYSDAKIVDMKEKGFGWYRCFRNSGWPCSSCDDVCAVPHRITETVLPVHPNCVCGMYPIDDSEL